jgi:hypothetical protein
MLPVNYVDRINSNPATSTQDKVANRDPLISEALDMDKDKYRLVYSKQHGRFTVFSLPSKTVQYTKVATNVGWCDLAIDTEYNPVIAWQDTFGVIHIDHVETGVRTITTFNGKYPSCALNELGDIVLAYNSTDAIEYRLSSESFLLRHEVTAALNFGYGQVAGLDVNNLIVKVEHTDAVLFAIGDNVMYIEDNLVGYEWGVVPWDKN